MPRVIHIYENPFPLVRRGRVIVNQHCECGHLRTSHEDTSAYGSGRCGACRCRQFHRCLDDVTDQPIERKVRRGAI